METKPYNIQSPEQIAKDYGGNKQKIAVAMQMGVIDPTAGTLAGMFIDRMRSAQMQEQAPQQTVAQQVFAPPAPPAPTGGGAPMGAPPMGPPAGLGATPEAAQMAPPPAQMPPQEAPVGMAMGGLTTLPIPDAMFDEPDNGGYADGGIVAFAAAGPVGSWFEETATSAIPGIQVTSRKRTPAQNAQAGGVSNSYHLTDNARDFVPPRGMSMSALAAQLKSTFGPGYDVINEGDHVHVEPGSRNTRANASAQPGAASSGASTAPWGGTLASKVPGAFKDAEAYYNKYMPEMKNEGMKAMVEDARRTLDPEEQKKRRNEDKWAMLAEIGFNIAGSDSPYLLQAVGKAAAAALPGARAAKKEREAEKRQAYRDLAEAEGITYKQAMDKANYIRDVAKENYDISDRDITRAADQQKTIFTQAAETERTGMQIAGQQRIAETTADSYRKAEGAQQAQLERQAALEAPKEAREAAKNDPAYQQAMDAGNAAAVTKRLRELENEYYFRMTGKNLPSATPPASGNAGNPAAANQGPKEGQKAKAANGRDMVFQGGRWVYTS